jgi:hypothetical protein
MGGDQRQHRDDGEQYKFVVAGHFVCSF